MRDASEPVERIGVEVSATYVARAAVLLACADSSASFHVLSESLGKLSRAPTIAVWTKSDLRSPTEAELAASVEAIGAARGVSVSAETGRGLRELIDAVTETLSGEATPVEIDAPILVQERHRFAVSTALDEVRGFRDAWGSARYRRPSPRCISAPL